MHGISDATHTQAYPRRYFYLLTLKTVPSSGHLLRHAFVLPLPRFLSPILFFIYRRISCPGQAKEEFNDLRVGILHLASLIDSVVRYDQLKGRLLPAQSRVRLLQAQASKAGATLAIGGPEVQPAGSDGGERREEIGGAAAADRGLSTADAETTSAADGKTFIHELLIKIKYFTSNSFGRMPAC